MDSEAGHIPGKIIKYIPMALIIKDTLSMPIMIILMKSFSVFKVCLP